MHVFSDEPPAQFVATFCPNDRPVHKKLGDSVMYKRSITIIKMAILAIVVLLTSVVLTQGTTLADSLDKSTHYARVDGLAPLMNVSEGATTIEGEYIVVLNINPVNARMSINQVNVLVDSVISSHVTAHGGKTGHTFNSAIAGFSAELDAKALAAVRSDSRVAFVTPNQRISISADQTGPTWGLDRIDQENLPLDNNYHYDYDGTGVDAYIIDTGILASHNDFGGRVVGGYNGMVGESTTNWGDCNGHGTHVAGTVGGTTWGVAKNVSLYGVRTLGCDGSGSTAGVIAGVDWVTSVASGPSVANMSLGGGIDPALDQAVQNSIASGITYVVASGNDNVDACASSPARVDQAITVNASNISDQRAIFSNYGSCTDIFAPGENISSAWHTGNDAFVTISGTSMAAPHVAGVVALFLEENGSSSPTAVKTALESFAFSNKISNPGPGSTNLLLNAIVSGELPPTPTPTPTATPLPGETVWEDDFESNKGWTTNPNGSDNASTGAWEWGNPAGTNVNGPKQLDETASGEFNLSTGPLAGETASGEHDLDSGVSSVRSPDITIPAGTFSLYFNYYLAHGDNSSADDFLTVQIVGSSTETVFQELGAADNDNGAWSFFGADISQFAGETVHVLISAADNGAPSLVEAAIDDVIIKGDAAPPPPSESVELEAKDGTVAVGSASQIELVVNGGDVSVGAVGIVVNYDETLLSITGCEQLDFLGECDFDTAGEVRISGANLDGKDGTSTVARLTIEGQAAGTSDIDIVEVTSLADSSGRDLLHTLKSGQVVVSDALLMGDANCDAQVTAVDAMVIMQFEVGQRTDHGGCGLTEPGGQIFAGGGDVNGDEQTTALDALLIMQCEVNISNTFCPAP